MSDPPFLSGKLLLAMPGMADPRFERSVTALCIHDDNGAVGIGLSHKRAGIRLRALLEGLAMDVAEVDADFAERSALAYGRWGKGFHAAQLNYGDSFSYALAEMYDCPLLYVGDDFAQTDIRSALI